MLIKNERVITVDCDDTLVMHAWQNSSSRTILTYVADPIDSRRKIELRVNENMVRLVKEEHARGSTIIVWSRGGYQWANNVVEALDIKDLVTAIMTKPLTYFDDSPVENWMKDRVYIGPDEPYKKQIV